MWQQLFIFRHAQIKKVSNTQGQEITQRRNVDLDYNQIIGIDKTLEYIVKELKIYEFDTLYSSPLKKTLLSALEVTSYIHVRQKPAPFNRDIEDIFKDNGLNFNNIDFSKHELGKTLVTEFLMGMETIKDEGITVDDRIQDIMALPEGTIKKDIQEQYKDHVPSQGSILGVKSFLSELVFSDQLKTIGIVTHGYTADFIPLQILNWNNSQWKIPILSDFKTKYSSLERGECLLLDMNEMRIQNARRITTRGIIEEFTLPIEGQMKIYEQNRGLGKERIFH